MTQLAKTQIVPTSLALTFSLLPQNPVLPHPVAPLSDVYQPAQELAMQTSFKSQLLYLQKVYRKKRFICMESGVGVGLKVYL